MTRVRSQLGGTEAFAICCTAGWGERLLLTEFHGLSENPFTITPSPRLAWLGAGMRRVREELCEAVLDGQGLLVLCGDVGVGKSLALILLAGDVERSGTPCRVLAVKCSEGSSAAALLRRIPEDAADGDGAPAPDRWTVLLVDEAHHLGAAELGALLSALALRDDDVCLVLAGTPELELAVDGALAEHPVTVATHWSIEPLSQDEIGSYVSGRLQAAGGEREIFTAGAIESLARHSGGVPRRLNVMCSNALDLASRRNLQIVDASIVEAAWAALTAKARLPAPVSAPMSHPPIEPAAAARGEDVGSRRPEHGARPVASKPVASTGARHEARESAEPIADRAEPIVPQASRSASGFHPVPPEHEPFASTGPTRPRRLQLQPPPRGGASQNVGVRQSRLPDPYGRPPKWSRIRRRYVAYGTIAGVAAIVLLFVALEWDARVETPADRASLPMVAEAIPPAAPAIGPATNPPAAPSEGSGSAGLQSSPADPSSSPATNAQTLPSEGPGPAIPQSPPADPSTGPVTNPPTAPPQDASSTRHQPPTAAESPANADLAAPAAVPAEQSPTSAAPANADAPQKDDPDAPAANEGGQPTIGQEELAQLLARARHQIQSFALTTPPGDNALETLQRVLAAIPGQPDALRGIHDVASRYALLAVQAERRGEHALAGRYVDRGLNIAPDHRDLLSLRQKLAAPRDEISPAERSAWITTLVEKLERERQP